MKDLAIFIDSFDGNADVWPAFFSIQEYYWKDCIFDKYLISNFLDYKMNRVTIIKTGEERSWFPMTIKGLESINEDYVLFLLEDYAISKAISNDEILKIVEKMKELNIYYYRLTCSEKFPKLKDFIEVPESTPYPISLQPAIWRRESMISILKKLDHDGAKTPWDFEKYFIQMYSKACQNKTIKGIRYDSRDILGYKNLIVQGRWDPRVVKFFKKKGIELDIGQRPYMTRKEVIMDGLKCNKIVRTLSYKQQARLKKVLKKMGFKFMT